LEKQLATIRLLRIQGAKIIICGHLGRPTAGVFEKQYSLAPVRDYYEKKLDTKIAFVEGEISVKAGSTIARMAPGDIVMLDNLRFSEGEKKNSRKFAKLLASFADIYVCDAFANAHRADASMDKIKMLMPAHAGLLLEQEIINLSSLKKPEKPLVVVLGGAKIETKLPMVKQFKNKAHRILIGGALANNFLQVRGYEIGKSMTDPESLSFAKKYKKNNLVLPVDVVVAKDDSSSRGVVKKVKDVKKDEYIFDIGPETIKLYSKVIKQANSIIWNGPMGFFEAKTFRDGTTKMAEAIAARSKGKCYGVVGGGETVEALRLTKLEKNIDWVSTGGGAMLAYLGNLEMPGLDKIVK